MIPANFGLSLNNTLPRLTGTEMRNPFSIIVAADNGVTYFP